MATITTTLAANESESKCTHADTIFLHLFPINETWNEGVRGLLYFLGLIYLFMGIAITSEAFMGSIEKITDKTKLVPLSSSKAARRNNGRHSNIVDGKEVMMTEVSTWNGTVANLTLMALGTCAPEILLSVIEIVKNRFEVGELGPGTIVGSAALNLLVITPVCIIAIPKGEIRSIKIIKVFFVTAASSILAYVWLLIILKFVSPNIVELWEAIVTFLLFPVLVLIAWATDRNWKFGKNHRHSCTHDDDNYEDCQNHLRNSSDGVYRRKSMFDANGALHKDSGLIQFYKVLRKYPHLTDSDAATLAAIKVIDSQPRSRLWYRIGAVRELTGHRKIRPSISGKLQEVFDTINARPSLVPILNNEHVQIIPPKKCLSNHDRGTIEFLVASCAVRGNVGTFKVIVVRHGNLQSRISVKVESMDGTAKQGTDYFATNVELIFDPNDTRKEFSVSIIDHKNFCQLMDGHDHHHDHHQSRLKETEFFLKLSIIGENDGGLNHKNRQTSNNKVVPKISATLLGRLAIMEVVVLEDGEPGVLSFRKSELLVKRSVGYASLQVERTNGADGEVGVRWIIMDDTNRDQSGDGEKRVGGTLIFKNGELVKTIQIPIDEEEEGEDPSIILERGEDRFFEVELFEPSRGAKLGHLSKVSIHVSNDSDFDSVLDRWLSMTTDHVKGASVEAVSWRSKIVDSFSVNGGDVEGASSFDFWMHFLTFFWKVLFACVIPPAKFWGGWLTFVSSLVATGLLTSLVMDLATCFGCVVGLKDTVTAVTVVALGTSMPDLFASMTAATKEKYGDNAIGNVTGSNSVIVFCGLGLPWTVAAFYHQANGQEFRVPPGSTAFSVLMYTIVSIVGIALILVRRYWGIFGAELGGPTGLKWASGIFMFLLWIVYITLSILQCNNIIEFEL